MAKRMNVKQREEVSRLMVDGYSASEIAEHIGVSKSTVFRALAKARAVNAKVELNSAYGKSSYPNEADEHRRKAREQFIAELRQHVRGIESTIELLEGFV